MYIILDLITTTRPTIINIHVFFFSFQFSLTKRPSDLVFTHFIAIQIMVPIIFFFSFSYALFFKFIFIMYLLCVPFFLLLIYLQVFYTFFFFKKKKKNNSFIEVFCNFVRNLFNFIWCFYLCGCCCFCKLCRKYCGNCFFFCFIKSLDLMQVCLFREVLCNG